MFLVFQVKFKPQISLKEKSRGCVSAQVCACHLHMFRPRAALCGGQDLQGPEVLLDLQSRRFLLQSTVHLPAVWLIWEDSDVIYLVKPVLFALDSVNHELDSPLDDSLCAGQRSNLHPAAQFSFSESFNVSCQNKIKPMKVLYFIFLKYKIRAFHPDLFLFYLFLSNKCCGSKEPQFAGVRGQRSDSSPGEQNLYFLNDVMMKLLLLFVRFIRSEATWTRVFLTAFSYLMFVCLRVWWRFVRLRFPWCSWLWCWFRLEFGWKTFDCVLAGF